MSRRREIPVEELAKGILAGERAMLSRGITLVESRLARHREQAEALLTKVMGHQNSSFRLGITGVPGVGKSTFIEAFGMEMVQAGHKLAVLAVDPTSQRSHGSILGDKTRMQELSRHPNVFIRPSPAGESLGGVTHKTRESILLCEAAGFSHVLVETVGVGQSETAVHGMVDFFLLLMLPGAGDELQGIKRGIMEMADGLVINKADGPNLQKAKIARANYKNALHLMPPTESGWIPPVLLASALEKSGLEEVMLMLESYQEKAGATGFFQKKRRAQALEWMEAYLKTLIEEDFFGGNRIQEAILHYKEKVAVGEVPPTVAARAVWDLYQSS